MNFYFMVSLAVVFGLLTWWLLLAISGFRDKSFNPRTKSVPIGRLGRWANSLSSILRFWRQDKCHRNKGLVNRFEPYDLSLEIEATTGAISEHQK